MSKWVLFLGLSLLTTACATSPQPSAQAAAAPGGQPQMVVPRGTEPASQKLICTDISMGYHIPQRICLTPEQVAARQKAAQEATQNSQVGQSKACATGETGC